MLSELKNHNISYKKMTLQKTKHYVQDMKILSLYPRKNEARNIKTAYYLSNERLQFKVIHMTHKLVIFITQKSKNRVSSELRKLGREGEEEDNSHGDHLNRAKKASFFNGYTFWRNYQDFYYFLLKLCLNVRGEKNIYLRYITLKNRYPLSLPSFVI